MEQTDHDNIKKISQYIKDILEKPLSKLILAMIMILIVIAILLIQGVNSRVIDSGKTIDINEKNVFIETDDERLVNFVKGYFRARTYLDFVNIYRAFDKNYIVMQDTEESKRYENGILYEKNYVSGYNNVKVYEHEGLKDNEKVVLIMYDMAFYFSGTPVPSILMAYVVEDNNKMYFKDNYDIGETKYINALMETNEVRAIYKDIKDRLEMTIINDSNLKLAYNSLRQYDMNPNNDMLKDKDMLIGKVFGNEHTKEKELIDLARKKEGIYEEK